MNADFLVEIGTEELPPKSLLTLANAFRDEVASGLKAESLDFGIVKVFATPRRLAVLVTALDNQAPSKNFVTWGPPAKVAFDQDGNPTRAAEAFANKNNIAIAEIKNNIEHDGKQDKLCHRATVLGKKTADLLAPIVEAALSSLPIPKKMRWGASHEEFVRPIHWIVLMLGVEVINATIMGLKSNNMSRGHRFHSNGDVTISSPSAYQQTMRSAYVITDFSERRDIIRRGVSAAATRAGGHAVINDSLLDEVTALNEWPIPLLGQFETKFLAVPAEALVSSMAEHQKYFHIVDDNQQLLPMFITVANIDSSDPAQVISGNERVIRARLSDAAFFYERDLKVSLEQRRESLTAIIFQKRLGSVFDKTERVAKLAEALCAYTKANPELAIRAAQLSKSDLVSEMVTEFDDLQGIMGRYYAINDGQSEQVATALFEQYLPRFSGDCIPATATGITLALADRLDTLVGIFAIGQPPTGSKDPFALRRASLGVLRIIIERHIDIDLYQALALAVALHSKLNLDSTTSKNITEQVLTYMVGRLKAWYEDENIPTEVFLAVAEKQLHNPLDMHQRVQAVHIFSQLPEAAALAAANKRVANILHKQASITIPNTIDDTLLIDSAEQVLAAELAILNTNIEPLRSSRKYTEMMTTLARLQQPVDTFFDDVMVMVEDQALRNNRLALLQQLHNLFIEVADISLLDPAK